MAETELDYLLRALDDRDIGLTRDDVAWAFESSKTRDDMRAWVRDCLSSATLLTREELDFIENKAAKPVAGTNLSYSVSDESLEHAIGTLEASIVSIENQCRLMEAQKLAIEDIISRNASIRPSQDGKAQYSGRNSHEKGQLEFDQAELTESLKKRLDTSKKQAEGMVAHAPSSTDKAFEKDDRLLESLEKVLPQISSTDNVLPSFEEVDRLCRALVVQSSADIRSQVDASYNAAIQHSESQLHGHYNNRESKDTERQREALQAELDELCREIDGLSAMAVDNLYRNPITQAVRAAQQDTKMEKVTSFEYVTSVLSHLTTRLNAMNDHFQHLHAQSGALKTVSSALDAVVALKIDKTKTAQAGSHSPSKLSQKGLKPLRLVQANLSENQDPVVQLLKQLDVRILDPGNISKLTESLSTAAQEQAKKLASFSSTTEHSLAGQIAQSMAKVDADAQALTGAVFAPSKFKTIKLLSSEAQQSIDRLEEKTRRLGDEMRLLDLNEVAGTLREKQQNVLQNLQ